MLVTSYYGKFSRVYTHYLTTSDLLKKKLADYTSDIRYFVINIVYALSNILIKYT